MAQYKNIKVVPLLIETYREISSQTISIIVPPPPDPGCKEDRECASREACFDGDCKNPCTVIKPCARNAECKVHSSLPLRTMSCTCLPGFTGKGDVRCTEISKL